MIKAVSRSEHSQDAGSSNLYKHSLGMAAPFRILVKGCCPLCGKSTGNLVIQFGTSATICTVVIYGIILQRHQKSNTRPSCTRIPQLHYFLPFRQQYFQLFSDRRGMRSGVLFSDIIYVEWHKRQPDREETNAQIQQIIAGRNLFVLTVVSASLFFRKRHLLKNYIFPKYSSLQLQ